MQVESFDLEENRDFLIIYDGAHPSAPVLARLTGKAMTSPLIISSQNNVYVYLFTNHAISRKGFSIAYKKGCDNMIRSEHGTLISPGYTRVAYPTSQVCKYTVELPEEESITLAVNSFDVAEDDTLQANIYNKYKCF